MSYQVASDIPVTFQQQSYTAAAVATTDLRNTGAVGLESEYAEINNVPMTQQAHSNQVTAAQLQTDQQLL
jgi:hypothetical protein